MAERGRAQGRGGYAGTWPQPGAAQAGGLAPSSLGLWPALAAKLREWIAAEAGAGRLMPWVPVAFGVGIALYFAADHEPVAMGHRDGGDHPRHGSVRAAAAQDLSDHGDDRGHGGGLCRGDLADR